jgi:hypothetical protein
VSKEILILEGIIQKADLVNRNPSRPYYYDGELPVSILKPFHRKNKINKIFKNG